jgi:hypothetical protein
MNYIAEPAIAIVVVALCLIALRFGPQKQSVADNLEQIDRDAIAAALASERGESFELNLTGSPFHSPSG